VTGLDMGFVGDLKERFEHREKLTRIRELVDLSHIRLRNRQIDEAHYSYGDINMIYRELPASVRRVVHSEVMGLGKQINMQYIMSLIEDARQNLRYGNIDKSKELYAKIRSVYEGFEDDQKKLVYPKLNELIKELKR